ARPGGGEAGGAWPGPWAGPAWPRQATLETALDATSGTPRAQDGNYNRSAMITQRLSRSGESTPNFTRMPNVSHWITRTLERRVADQRQGPFSSATRYAQASTTASA